MNGRLPTPRREYREAANHQAVARGQPMGGRGQRFTRRPPGSREPPIAAAPRARDGTRTRFARGRGTRRSRAQSLHRGRVAVGSPARPATRASAMASSSGPRVLLAHGIHTSDVGRRSPFAARFGTGPQASRHGGHPAPAAPAARSVRYGIDTTGTRRRARGHGPSARAFGAGPSAPGVGVGRHHAREANAGSSGVRGGRAGRRPTRHSVSERSARQGGVLTTRVAAGFVFSAPRRRLRSPRFGP